ncbi:glutamate racemase [Ferruginibacter lapsinanis]|uniref:glutamate racemase n=1 Tax=Ferruginibacter lapsinanis TaxID=563172 RepID=UPI001E43CD44|nr:glutamate racemase [Ferruginibacter lapsinanis]UEG51004.1 glutamate racemase [Ferruginibacter lapsinanis]
MSKQGAIGVFDSGYGGLTVLKEIVESLPQYDYLYLGDNARAPYGTRSFTTVYEYTLQCVKWFFQQGCPLVILACNTASAKALRTIQQNDLVKIDSSKRVLGVIRPTTEIAGSISKTNHIGILGTNGTVQSNSYPMEISKFYPSAKVYQEACPMWVPLIENNEYNLPGADYFVKKHIDHLLAQSNEIDTILLACTHYPLLMDKIKEHVPPGINVVSQGEIVAKSLVEYLQRHPEIDQKLSKNAQISFFTTDSAEDFDSHASAFYGKSVKSTHLAL